MKDDRAVALFLPFKNVAGFAHKMRNVDGGERIGAFDDEEIAIVQPAQGLARAQGRQRTIKAAKVESSEGRRVGIAKSLLRPRLENSIKCEC